MQKDASPTVTSAVSSAERPMDHYMNFWLERIKTDDIARLWTTLRDYARAAGHPISSEGLASGIIFEGDCQVDVTAHITQDGFVLRFTVAGTCKSGGEAKP